ncbi:MAG: tail fiber domain-containing protein, partial [Acidobacteriota bacterium]|nr:tail fiber domain-containing protein [Acidobacteriota bacterium]
VSAGNFSYATAIGARATVTANNTVQLGRDALDTVRVGKLGTGGTTVLCQNASSEISDCGVTNFVSDTDPRLSDSRDPNAGSSFYIQNGTGQQTSADFNIDGNGEANIFNAATQYNLNGNRMLSSPGTQNLFIGRLSGSANTTGQANVFVGGEAGMSNTSGVENSFFGRAGLFNTTGIQNAFFGHSTGGSNTTGSSNAFFGSFAGQLNTTGGGNSFFGSRAGKNSLGILNTFVGSYSGESNTVGTRNTFLGMNSGAKNINGNRNVHIGGETGNTADNGDNNTFLGYGSNAGTNSVNFATAIGSGAQVTASNTIQLGRNGTDTVRIGTTGSAGATSLCLNASNEIATCSSSIRYKSEVNPFVTGLELVRRLQPVSFRWTNGGAVDLGFVAEDVNDIEPLLTTTKNGRVEGVKYDRIGVVLVNAVREQQLQIEEQQEQIVSQEGLNRSLQTQIEDQGKVIENQNERLRKQESELERQKVELDALKAAVCSSNPDASVCK